MGVRGGAERVGYTLGTKKGSAGLDHMLRWMHQSPETRIAL